MNDYKMNDNYKRGYSDGVKIGKREIIQSLESKLWDILGMVRRLEGKDRRYICRKCNKSVEKKDWNENKELCLDCIEKEVV